MSASSASGKNSSTRSIRDWQARHRERHRASGFGLVLADRIEYLDASRWDYVAANGSLFLRRDVLRVVERDGPENLLPRYAIVFRKEEPVAILAAQIVTVTGERLRKKGGPTRSASGLLRRVFSPVFSSATANLRERMLVAGNLLSWGFHGIAFAAGIEPAELWPGIAEALYRIRRAERLTGQTNFVMVKDLTDEQKGLDALHRFSYRPMQTEPNMVLKLDPGWRSYEDYLAALDAKYRRNAKEHMKKLTAAGCVVQPLSELTTESAELYRLYLSVHHHAAVRLVTVPEAFLPALARTLKDNFRCTVVRRDDTLLGFVTTLRDGNTAIAYYIGFDRDAAANGLPIYLRLLHVTVADAINWGCSKLSLGRTALEPKAALGAKPEPMTIWLRHRVPTLNWLIRGLLGGVPHAEAPERSPFKVNA
jgi:hypothetical protein